MKPNIIRLYGDKSRKLEPDHSRIEFPGGSIAVDRTSDGLYWAHIAINSSRDPTQIVGQVVGSRVDFDHSEWRRRVEAGESPIPDIDGMENAQHFAVCINPKVAAN